MPLRRDIPALAAASNSSSPSTCSSSASAQSDSSAKCTSPSRLARWWTSSSSICLSTFSREVSKVGTTTIVRTVAGTPSFSSSAGNRVLLIARVTLALTSPTAASSAGIAPSTPSTMSQPVPSPIAHNASRGTSRISAPIQIMPAAYPPMPSAVVMR